MSFTGTYSYITHSLILHQFNSHNSKFDRQKKGKYTRLAGRHANYNISTKSATQWITYMDQAVNGHPKRELNCIILQSNQS